MWSFLFSEEQIQRRSFSVDCSKNTTSRELCFSYQPAIEEYDVMSPEAIIETFWLDIDFLLDFNVETRAIAHFDGLRNPIHQ